MSTEKAAEGGAAAAAGEGSILDEILSLTPMKPTDDGYALTQKGVAAFISNMITSGKSSERVDKNLVDIMLAEVDARLSAQINEIMHHPAVQKLESAWRGLKFLVDKTDFRENIAIEILNVSKEDLITDFEDSPEVVKSGLYRLAYANEYGVFGGKPYGLMVGNYDFGHGAQDIELLGKLASVSAMAHAPFIGNTAPEFFDKKSFEEVSQIKELKMYLDGPQYARWHSFRESEDARYVGLTMPRFMLRLPYGEGGTPVKDFNFNEDVVGKHDNYLWGYASTAMASRIVDSFAKFRWAPNIIGPQSGGSVDNLPLHNFSAMGELQSKVPTETLITDRREFELSEEGFISLSWRKGSDSAAFFSANSCQKAKTFGNTPEGKAAETNYRLGTQLPYMFIVTRLSHYMKVLQREQIGSWKERSDLERELNQWISQYVSDMDDPAAAVRSRRPLRKAQITVEDVPGQPGWYRSTLKVRPHFKYMGATFELSLVGKLDKE